MKLSSGKLGGGKTILRVKQVTQENIIDLTK
jgi:hypothetical protein